MFTVSALQSAVVRYGVILSKNFPIFVELCKLLQVVDIVLVPLKIKTMFHSSKFFHLLKVNIVPEIISLKFPLFFPVLFESLIKLLELLYSLENVCFFRFNVICFDKLNILLGSKTLDSLCLDTALALNNVYLLLEHLLVFPVWILVIFEMVLPTFDLIHFVRFFVQVV